MPPLQLQQRHLEGRCSSPFVSGVVGAGRAATKEKRWRRRAVRAFSPPFPLSRWKKRRGYFCGEEEPPPWNPDTRDRFPDVAIGVGEIGERPRRHAVAPGAPRALLLHACARNFVQRSFASIGAESVHALNLVAQVLLPLHHPFTTVAWMEWLRWLLEMTPWKTRACIPTQVETV
ncbi:hypothetical protein HPB51_013765 [Rhipicephalus microplus]|uniref:Uncharacterized protein n=1 Tax=Rhipicephalus microplus TaxID=6941 RepID=A0A9J6F3H7_RHIMP|nr:hypothetical protein HPB51_013765 [Rhipicephalus microplus]